MQFAAALRCKFKSSPKRQGAHVQALTKSWSAVSLYTGRPGSRSVMRRHAWSVWISAHGL